MKFSHFLIFCQPFPPSMYISLTGLLWWVGWNLASQAWLPGLTYSCRFLPPVRLPGQLTHRDLTPYTWPGAWPPVRARQAGPPRSNHPLEQPPHLSTTLTVTVFPWYSSSAQAPQPRPLVQSCPPTAANIPEASPENGFSKPQAPVLPCTQFSWNMVASPFSVPGLQFTEHWDPIP